MKPRHVVTLLAMVLIVGGYISVSWWIGMSTQARMQQNEQQLLSDASYLTLISRDYRRGIFSSTEDVTYGIGGSMAQMLHTPGAAAALSSVRLSVHNRIEHGPLPGFSTLAFASIDSQLQLPAAVQRAMQTILHGRSLLQAHTVLHWSGNSEIMLDSPPFQYRLPDGTQIVWDGVRGTVRANAAAARWSGQISAPGLTVDGPQGRFELHGLGFNADMQRALDTFFIGSSEARLSSISAHALSGGAFSVQGVLLQSDSSLNAGYIDQHVSLTAERVDVAQLSLTRVGYVQTLSHLHADSLAALVAALREMQRELPAGRPIRGPAANARLTAFSRYGLALAVHEPVLNIERVGFATPEGELRLSAKLAIPGLSPQELQEPAAMAALMTHLDVVAELRVDAPLLDKLLEASGKREQVSAGMEQLEGQGYLHRDGNTFTTSLVFRAGALTINGLPYRPLGNMTTP